MALKWRMRHTFLWDWKSLRLTRYPAAVYHEFFYIPEAQSRQQNKSEWSKTRRDQITLRDSSGNSVALCVQPITRCVLRSVKFWISFYIYLFIRRKQHFPVQTSLTWHQTPLNGLSTPQREICQLRKQSTVFWFLFVLFFLVVGLLSAGFEKNDVVVLHNLLISQALWFAYGSSRLALKLLVILSCIKKSNFSTVWR